MASPRLPQLQWFIDFIQGQLHQISKKMFENISKYYEFQVSIQALLKSLQPGQGRRSAEQLEFNSVRNWSCSVKEA